MPSGNFNTGSVTFNQTEGGFTGTGNISSVFLTSRTPPTPANGPPVPYVYTNNAGTFKLSTGAASGIAKYIWQGMHNNDALTYLAFGVVLDNSGIGLPVNSSVDVWLYMASDTTGNTWYLAFGVDELTNINEKYPLYYSYTNPVIGGNLKRWITPSGTDRI